jgi:hypothetical protein
MKADSRLIGIFKAIKIRYAHVFKVSNHWMDIGTLRFLHHGHGSDSAEGGTSDCEREILACRGLGAPRA